MNAEECFRQIGALVGMRADLTLINGVKVANLEPVYAGEDNEMVIAGGDGFWCPVPGVLHHMYCTPPDFNAPRRKYSLPKLTSQDSRAIGLTCPGFWEPTCSRDTPLVLFFREIAEVNPS